MKENPRQRRHFQMACTTPILPRRAVGGILRRKRREEEGKIKNRGRPTPLLAIKRRKYQLFK